MDKDCFFDSRDEISSVSGSECSEPCLSSSARNDTGASDYEIWTKNLESVDVRRSRLLNWMGLSSDSGVADRDESNCDFEITVDDRVSDNCDTVLANTESADDFFCGRDEDLECVRDDDQGFRRAAGSSLSSSSSLVQKLLRRDSSGGSDNAATTKKKLKTSWLQKLIEEKSRKMIKSGRSKSGCGLEKVRVHTHKKDSKELSSLHTGQEFHAHKGSILTMKFSPDGEHLASAGTDGVVRVWKVVASEAPKNLSHQDVDPSSLYFSMSDLSKLTSLDLDKEKKIGQAKRFKKSSESACVILPPKVFRILEQPVHEFCGHLDEVLALSWSRNGFLLSSSADKTARLWQIGHDQCLGVFPHNNYVTCVEFNPLDDNYFISGSLDGKVRLWEIKRARVIDWIDVKEIVTALCYRPDGTGGVVGSIDGSCIFYDVEDNRLQITSQVSLQGKKKPNGKRVTGFQFCPNDSTKVMVTSADSQVKILHGANVICKFKGSRNCGSQVPATFTPDGKHVVSVSDDSNVHIWNYNGQDATKKNIWSSESFYSDEASIAIPWCGFETNSPVLPGGRPLSNGEADGSVLQRQGPTSPDCFSLGRGFFLDPLNRGSATWPEETLPEESSPVTVTPAISKPDYKILKSAWQSTFNSPNLWGHVVVTAGLDGCIRTFLNYGLPVCF
ncbi:unnamed protein product [Cuscuta campestris]|uniref:Uncharacterized protein n=1 Tax=Cuscuta campestris TaxID=132261 RepID=A0A484KTM0_9ASTE|nr:unnamed protein product [Cuscuta campestris]